MCSTSLWPFIQLAFPFLSPILASLQLCYFPNLFPSPSTLLSLSSFSCIFFCLSLFLHLSFDYFFLIYLTCNPCLHPQSDPLSSHVAFTLSSFTLPCLLTHSPCLHPLSSHPLLTLSPLISPDSLLLSPHLPLLHPLASFIKNWIYIIRCNGLVEVQVTDLAKEVRLHCLHHKNLVVSCQFKLELLKMLPKKCKPDS